MTTAHTQAAAAQTASHYPLPDRPEWEPDDMTSFKHLAEYGNVRDLADHLGNPQNTHVDGERYLVRVPFGSPQPDMTRLRYRQVYPIL